MLTEDKRQRTIMDCCLSCQKAFDILAATRKDTMALDRRPRPTDKLAFVEINNKGSDCKVIYAEVVSFSGVFAASRLRKSPFPFPLLPFDW